MPKKLLSNIELVEGIGLWGKAAKEQTPTSSEELAALTRGKSEIAFLSWLEEHTEQLLHSAGFVHKLKDMAHAIPERPDWCKEGGTDGAWCDHCSYVRQKAVSEIIKTIKEA